MMTILGRILIVDDEMYARQAVSLALSKAGYEIIEAEDGAQALHVMAQGENAALVDTILCDLQMPTVDGNQAISHFKRQYPDIPLVIITGAPDFILTDVLKNQGVADYLVKPVRDTRILEVVRRTVRLRQLRRSQR